MSGGTRSYEMARRLVAWGHEVHMITTDREGASASENSKWRCTQEAGIHVHWTYVPYNNKLSYFDRIKAFFVFAWRAARKAVEIGGDIVFATSTPLTIAIPGVYASKRLKIPMVFEVRDLWPEVPIALKILRNPLNKRAALWLEKFAYENASHIVALAPGMKEHIVKTGYPETKISVIPNGADVDFFNVPEETGRVLRRHYAWLGDRKMVLYAGTLGSVNGVDYLVDLAVNVQKAEPEICFVVLGSGKEENRLTRHAECSGVLNKNFFMLGQIPKNTIPAWFSAATACVVFYSGPEVVWRDSVPNKFFDCLAAKKPFISNIRGWSQCISEQMGAGIILDLSDKDKSTNMFIDFLSDRKRLENASCAASGLANCTFNRSSLARQLEVILVNTAISS